MRPLTPLRLVTALLAVFTMIFPGLARASDAPAPAIVVVVEAPHALLDPSGVRRVLGTRLERPCLSLLDDAAPEAAAVLSVVLDARGHGRIELRPRGGVASYVAIDRPRRAARSGGWLASSARQLIEAGMDTPGRRFALCREVLDPWPPTSVEAARAARLELPSEVLDPFADSGPRPAHAAAPQRVPRPMVISEVLDPWRDYHPAPQTNERADRLSRPRPGVPSR